MTGWLCLRHSVVMDASRVDGQLLRALRTEHGLRQRDLASQVGLSRSAWANIEAGREAASAQVIRRLIVAFPPWRESIESGIFFPAATALNPSFAIMELTIAYVFLESRSPSEILQIRRVRAIRSGAQYFVLGVGRTDEADFATDTQVLWGGRIVDQMVDDVGRTMQTVEFPQALRAGQVHEFALRSWVERDAAPDTDLVLTVTTSTEHARIHLVCQGRPQIAEAWAYGPVNETEGLPYDSPHSHPLEVTPGAPITAVFDQLTPGPTYGTSWRW